MAYGSTTGSALDVVEIVAYAPTVASTKVGLNTVLDAPLKLLILVVAGGVSRLQGEAIAYRNRTQSTIRMRSPSSTTMWLRMAPRSS